MVTRANIDELIEYPAEGFPVVSFFLDVDGAHSPDLSYTVRADEMLRDARHRLEGTDALSAAQRESARADLERIGQFVHREFVRGDRRGLALFACHARGLWRIFSGACPLKDRLAIQERACVRPLILMMEENPRFGVALVDREKGHFFAIEQGEIVAQEEIADDVPGRIRPGSWYGLADRGIERRVDFHIHQHLKHMAAVLDRLVREEELARVLIGGTPDVVPEFRRTLTRRVRDRVAAMLPNPLNPTPAEVLARSIEAMRAVEAASEKALIDSALEGAGPKGHAAIGLEATLAALYQGAVERLLIGRGRVQPGFVCGRCGRLFAGEDNCPVCQNTSPTPVADIIEEAVDAALCEGAEVTFVEETPEWRERGGIGALLRFAL